MATETGENRYKKYGQPSLDLVFTGEKKSLTDRSSNVTVEFTRTQDTPSSYYKSDGTIGYASTDVPRFDHDPVTGESLGLLIEEARTQLVRDSIPKGNGVGGGWSQRVNTRVRYYQDLSPDGEFTATSVIPILNSTDYAYVVNNLASPTTSECVASTYAKPINGLSRFVLKTGVGSGAIIYRFNFDTGEITLLSNTVTPAFTPVPFMETLPNGWFRCGFTSAPGTDDITLNARESWGANQPAADGVTGMLFWGAQVTEGKFKTSLIHNPPTFTSRASTATYYDSSGVIQTAAIDEARDDAYFPDENGVFRPAGLLLEKSGTNYVTNSEEMNLSFTQQAQSVWTTSAPSVTAPDGSTTGIALTCNNGAVSRSNASFTYTFSADIYTFSVWIKEKDSLVGNKIHLRYGDVSDPHVVASTYTLSGIGSVGGDYENADFASIQKFPNDWYRCSMTFTAIAGSETIGIWFVPPLDASQTGASIYPWGAQLEEGTFPFPTSYIPTTGSTVTRAADISSSSTSTRGDDLVQITGSNFLKIFPSVGSGTIFVEGGVIGENLNTSTGSFASFGTNVNDNFLYFLNYDNRDNVGFTRPSAGNISKYHDLTDKTFKGATAWTDLADAPSTGSSALDGDLYGGSHWGFAGVQNPANYDRFGIGRSIRSSTLYSNINGHVKRLTYWPTRLPDSDLQRLTE